MKKVLYFEGAGMDFYEEESKKFSDVGNFRIRTSFFNNEGVQYYLELGNSVRYDKKGKVRQGYGIHVDHWFKISDKLLNEKDYEHGYEIKKDFLTYREIDYTKKNITQWINENMNCSFDTIEVLCNYYGYRVHGDNGTYNLMETIDLNHERAKKRKEKYDEIDMEYRKTLNEKYSKIGLLEMNAESITIRCHASKESLQGKNLERIVRIPIEYEKTKGVR